MTLTYQSPLPLRHIFKFELIEKKSNSKIITYLRFILDLWDRTIQASMENYGFKKTIEKQKNIGNVIRSH